MKMSPIETKRLKLVPHTRDEVLAQLAEMRSNEKVELSAAWLELLERSALCDPWIHGFALIHKETNGRIGSCGFKGPPSEDGVVEIAYGIDPEHQGQGYATEAAEALTHFAIGRGQVRLVRAHTLPQPNASTRVLMKCGFKLTGEVLDPDDGPVWRWEKIIN